MKRIYESDCCANCFYYRQQQCRRYPPVPQNHSHSPRGPIIVHGDDYWCGEFKDDEKARKEREEQR